MKAKSRPWLAAVGAFLLLFTSVGGGNNGISLFYIPVAADLGFNQTEFSLYYTVAVIAAMLTYPIFGRFYTKHMDKMKLSILIAGAVTMACYFLYARAQTLMQFYIISAVRGVCSSALSTVPATMIINNWFIKNRATVMSVVFMGSSAGGLAYTQLSNAIMKTWGWQTAYWVMGAVMFATIIIILIITFPSPLKLGLKPYGYVEGGEAADPSERWGISLGRALKLPAFWILGVGLFLSAAALVGIQQSVPSALQVDFNFSKDFAASIVSIFMIFICFGKVIVGWIYDKFNIKVGITYCSLLIIGSLLCLLSGSTATWVMYLFAVVFGLGNMHSTITVTTMVTETFGLKDYGTIYGFINMFVPAGFSVGPPIASAVFDATGSYKNAWIIFMAAIVVSTLLLYIVTFMAKKLKEENPAQSGMK